MTIVEPRTEPPPEAPEEKVKPHLTERARHERRLGLQLSAPAFVVMIIYGFRSLARFTDVRRRRAAFTVAGGKFAARLASVT